jgi:hypothetical protein
MESGGSMKIHCAPGLVLCALVLVGCSGGGAAGTYEFDPVATKSIEGGMPAGAPLGQIKGQLVLESDGTFTMTFDLAGKTTNRGTWTQDGSKLTFTVTHEDGRKRDTPGKGAATLAKGRIIYGNGPGGKMVFVRAR